MKNCNSDLKQTYIKKKKKISAFQFRDLIYHQIDKEISWEHTLKSREVEECGWELEGNEHQTQKWRAKHQTLCLGRNQKP